MQIYEYPKDPKGTGPEGRIAKIERSTRNHGNGILFSSNGSIVERTMASPGEVLRLKERAGAGRDGG